jgi:signal transduction histidine kinase
MSGCKRKKEQMGNEGTRREKTILFEGPSPSIMRVAQGPSESEPKIYVWSRLDHLFRITKLLLNFQELDSALTEILAIVSNTLPLATAILIEETKGRAQVSVWNDERVGEQRVAAAMTHAGRVYAYLTGSSPAMEKRADAARKADAGPHIDKGSERDASFIAIPMVVGRQPVFGVIQFEGMATFDEPDLTFLNAVANQLAIALDRHQAWLRELAARAEAEAAEGRMRFLADASRLLAASLDYPSTVESIAKLAVQSFADFCIVDMQTENRRRTILRSSDLPEEFQETEMERTLISLASDVLKTRRSIIHPRVSDNPETENRDVSEEVDRSFGSYMCVPLRINGHAIGTLTLVCVRPGRSYKPIDLALLEDLARRIVVTFENTQLYATALQAINSRDEVLRTVTHDLRGPLTVILGFLTVLLKKPRAKDLICDRSQVETIHRAADWMNRLIADLLDTTSIEARHLRIEPEPCAVSLLIGESVELLGLLAEQKSIALKTAFTEDIPDIFVDRGRILQVLGNLIGNAIKFTPAGGTVTVRARQVEQAVQFSVEDNGQGIPKDDVLYVFDRFWQAARTARLGTGLGLFIARGIVEGHGGRIWVESEQGVGSQFYFTLPIDSSHPEAHI